MKILLSICLSILIATIILNYLPVHGEEAVYENTVRLHVIAASDSEEDQALKLKVRDKVLQTVETKLKEVHEFDDACEMIDSIKEEIHTSAEAVIKEEGYAYPVKVEFDSEKYPVRYYDIYTLPEGIYRSLRITIGNGDGKNWWCILFPSVCVSDAVKAEDDYVAAGFTPEQYKLIKNGSGKKYKVRFRVLELLSEAIGFKY